MRVLAVGNVYPPHLLGGYEVIWQGVIEQLRLDGHEARVLTTDYRRPDVPADAADDPDVHRELHWYWHEHEWPAMGPLQRLRLERHNGDVFDRHLDEFQPDVIAWWPVGGMSLGLIERARRAGIPSAFFVLDYWPRYGPERDLWTRMWSRRPSVAAVVARLTGLPTRFELNGAGRWLFCSQAMLDDTVAAGLDTSDSAILAPGIERSYLETPRETEAPEWGWRLLYIGRVVEQKGVRTAIEALAQLPDQAQLRIVGKGDDGYRRALIELAGRLGVAGRVHFDPAQPRDALHEIYRGADVVVFPVQWDEPFGLVPLEAMALGRLVVATGTGGSGDFLADGTNSVLFAPRDARGLAAAVSALADSRELRARLRQGGYETAARHGEDAFNRRAIEELQSISAGYVRVKSGAPQSG